MTNWVVSIYLPASNMNLLLAFFYGLFSCKHVVKGAK